MAEDNKEEKKVDDKTDKPDLGKEIESLKAKNAEYEKKIAELSKKDDKQDDPELREKARKQREADDSKANDAKALERALMFNLKSADWLKTNGSLLPKTVSDLFVQAEKENYSSAIEKDAAIKSGIIQEFFSVQANHDLLTPGLKTSLDDYLKLTKTGKQEKAQSLYDSVFEPAFEMLKRTKKAEALSKGFGVDDDDQTAYKKMLMERTRKQYLGEK